MDLAGLFLKTGVKNQRIALLLTDAQIHDERFLVIINDLLASGKSQNQYQYQSYWVLHVFPQDSRQNPPGYFVFILLYFQYSCGTGCCYSSWTACMYECCYLSWYSVLYIITFVWLFTPKRITQCPWNHLDAMMLHEDGNADVNQWNICCLCFSLQVKFLSSSARRKLKASWLV